MAEDQRPVWGAPWTVEDDEAFRLANPPLPSAPDVYVIAEEFCGGCGDSMGYDLRPLTLLCPTCQAVQDVLDQRHHGADGHE